MPSGEKGDLEKRAQSGATRQVRRDLAKEEQLLLISVQVHSGKDRSFFRNVCSPLQLLVGRTAGFGIKSCREAQQDEST